MPAGGVGRGVAVTLVALLATRWDVHARLAIHIHLGFFSAISMPSKMMEMACSVLSINSDPLLVLASKASTTPRAYFALK